MFVDYYISSSDSLKEKSWGSPEYPEGLCPDRSVGDVRTYPRPFLINNNN